MTVIFVAMGANLPIETPNGKMSPDVTLRSAMIELTNAGHRVSRLSRLFATPCFPAGAGPDYLNAAAIVEMAGNPSPEGALAALHAVEARFARTRDVRWAGRTLDLDLLAMGDSVLPDPATYRHWRDLSVQDQPEVAPDRLILPHPRMQDRAFVLVPLAEIAPDWCHPVSGLTVRQMRDALPAADVAAIGPLPAKQQKPWNRRLSLPGSGLT